MCKLAIKATILKMKLLCRNCEVNFSLTAQLSPELECFLFPLLLLKVHTKSKCSHQKPKIHPKIHLPATTRCNLATFKDYHFFQSLVLKLLFSMVAFLPQEILVVVLSPENWRVWEKATDTKEHSPRFSVRVSGLDGVAGIPLVQPHLHWLRHYNISTMPVPLPIFLLQIFPQKISLWLSSLYITQCRMKQVK